MSHSPPRDERVAELLRTFVERRKLWEGQAVTRVEGTRVIVNDGADRWEVRLRHPFGPFGVYDLEHQNEIETFPSGRAKFVGISPDAVHELGDAADFERFVIAARAHLSPEDFAMLLADNQAEGGNNFIVAGETRSAVAPDGFDVWFRTYAHGVGPGSRKLYEWTAMLKETSARWEQRLIAERA